MPKQPNAPFAPPQVLPIVADSIEQLRKCDVWRLMQATPVEHRGVMYRWLLEQRPDVHLARMEDPRPGWNTKTILTRERDPQVFAKSIMQEGTSSGHAPRPTPSALRLALYSVESTRRS